MPRPHEMCLMECTSTPSPPPTGDGRTLSQGMGGRGHLFTGDSTNRYGPPYMVRPWMGMQGFASLYQCHGTLRRSYGSMEGNLVRQISGMARATCSCSTPPTGRWDPFCVCIGIWTYDPHSPGGIMRGFDTAMRGFPEPSYAHWQGFKGRYLKEWGVEVICLPETLLIDTDHRIWSDLGWGCKDSQVCINATGRLGGVMVAWKEISFDKLAEWRGRHVVAAHLHRRADGIHYVFASAYGPTIPTVRGELWEDLIQLCGAFPNLPTLM